MIIVQGGREAFGAMGAAVSSRTGISEDFMSSLSDDGMRSFQEIAPNYLAGMDRIDKAHRTMDVLREQGIGASPLDLYPVVNDDQLVWPSGIMQQVVMSHPGIRSTGIVYNDMDIFDTSSGTDNIFYRAITDGLVKRDGYQLHYTPDVLMGDSAEAMRRYDLTSLAITFDYLEEIVEEDLFSDIMDMDREWL